MLYSCKDIDQKDRLKVTHTEAFLDNLFTKNTAQTYHTIDSLLSVSTIQKDSLSLGYYALYKVKFDLKSNKLDSVLNYAETALVSGKKYKDDYLLARTNHLLGRYYILTSDYKNSLTLHLSSVAYFEKINDEKQLIYSYNDLGGFYMHNDELSKALSLYKKSYDLALKNKDYRGQALYFANLSSIDLDNQDFQQAIDHLKQAKKAFAYLNDTVNQIKVFTSIGEVNLLLKNTPEAKVNYSTALDLAQKTQDSTLMGPIYLGYGRLAEAQSNFNEAIAQYNQAYQITNNQKLYREEIDVLKRLSDIYQKTNQPDLAIKYLKMVYDKKEQLNGVRVNQDLEELRWNSIFEKKQHKYELEEQKHKTTIIIQIGIIVTITGLAILFVVLYLGKRKRLALASMVNNQLQNKLETEEALHFLQEEKHALEIENRDRELATVNLQLISKNKFLNDIEQVLNKDSKTVITDLKQIINSNRTLEKDWEQFTVVFEKVHPNFFHYINANFPDLTKTEVKICAYIKIKFNNYEIANLLNIDYQSVIKNRYRIRKKINLQNAEDLDKTIAFW
jgi:tetratricopeptide (TPR) repeat protein